MTLSFYGQIDYDLILIKYTLYLIKLSKIICAISLGFFLMRNIDLDWHQEALRYYVECVLLVQILLHSFVRSI